MVFALYMADLGSILDILYGTLSNSWNSWVRSQEVFSSISGGGPKTNKTKVDIQYLWSIYKTPQYKVQKQP